MSESGRRLASPPARAAAPLRGIGAHGLALPALACLMASPYCLPTFSFEACRPRLQVMVQDVVAVTVAAAGSPTGKRSADRPGIARVSGTGRWTGVPQHCHLSQHRIARLGSLHGP